MQKSLLAALLGVALIVPFAAHAEGSYVGVNVGQSNYQHFPISGGGDKSATVVGLNYGMNINPNFDIELGYLHHGNATKSNTVAAESLKLTTQSVYLAAIGKLPVTDGFNVYAKGGLSVNYTKANGVDTGVPFNNSKTKAGIIVGVGASYQLSKEWSGIVEYNYFDKPFDGDFKLSNWTVGARYHF